MREVDAGPAEPAPSEEVRAVVAGETYVALVRLGDAWLAFADACTHHDCPLSEGFVDGATIECACHGSVFDVRTGAVVRGPATEPIRVYRVSERDGRLLVDLEGLDGVRPTGPA
jgi:3-phenylpropionate/trans-cinnamate dioxygenase ferredoxin subunit